MIQDEFIWECQTNDDPWDETQTPKWTPYSNDKSSKIEKVYKNKLREILIDSNYRIDLENYRERRVRRRQCRFPLTASTDEESEDKLAHRERLSSSLGCVSACSASGDTTYYGSQFVQTWLLMFTEGKKKITFDNIYSTLLNGLIAEGQIFRENKLSKIEAQLRMVEEETRKKSSEKRIKDLQDCCAKLYTKPCFIFRVVNTALRNNDQSKLYTLGPFCYLLYNYIGRQFKDNSSIPARLRRLLHLNETQSLTVYRGDNISDDIIEEYRRAAGDNSKHFKWLPFVSTSRDQTVAERFVTSTLYIIEIRSYSSDEDRFTDLSSISDFAVEQEIVLLPGVQFHVNKVTFDNDKRLHSVYIKINSSYLSKLK